MRTDITYLGLDKMIKNKLCIFYFDFTVLSSA